MLAQAVLFPIILAAQTGCFVFRNSLVLSCFFARLSHWLLDRYSVVALTAKAVA